MSVRAAGSAKAVSGSGIALKRDAGYLVTRAKCANTSLQTGVSWT